MEENPTTTPTVPPAPENSTPLPSPLDVTPAAPPEPVSKPKNVPAIILLCTSSFLERC